MLKRNKIILKTTEWIVFIFLMCILAIVLSPFLPFQNVPKSFIVVTGSMEPTIKTGSVVFVKTINPKSIKEGDIIAFTSPSDPKDTILHRVNSISSTDPLLFKTKGDNNNTVDNWDVMGVGVKGVYIAAIPYLGNAAAFIRKPLGFSLIIGIPALFFIISQILNIKKAIADEVARKVDQQLKSKKSKNPKKKNKTKTKIKTKPLILSIIIFSIFINLLAFKIIKASFSDQVSVSGITLSVKDFVAPPVPTLISPTNGSITSTNGLIMKWNQVADYKDMNNPVYYIYQSSHSPNFDVLTYQSGHLSSPQIPTPGTPDGVYYWRVKACDAIDNCSDWSEIWKMTIDSTIPDSIITNPANSNNFISPQINFPPLRVWYWNGKIEGTAFDNLSGVNRVELSIERVGANLYWSGDPFQGINGWVNDPNTRVIAVGTTNWSYQINPFYLPFGKFKIVSHAIDNAGNIENSATIEFENTEIQTPATDIKISSNYSSNKINLEVTNISSEYNYEILYTGNGEEKGIIGHISTDEIIDSKYSKDFYLGTCSTDGMCTPEKIEIGSAITINLTGSQNLTKNFTY